MYSFPIQIIRSDGFKSPDLTVIIYISLYGFEKLFLFDQPIGPVGRLFANGTGDRDSIPSRVIPKTQKMVLDTSLLKTQHYKIRIKGKVEQSRERSSTLPYTLL